jgi:hypothetical protein
MTDEKLTECKACDEPCSGEYCSDECREYYETRDKPL